MADLFETLVFAPEVTTPEQAREALDGDLFPLAVLQRPDLAAQILSERAGLPAASELLRAIIDKDIVWHRHRIKHSDYIRSNFRTYIEERVSSSNKSRLLLSRMLNEIHIDKTAFLDAGCGLGYSMLHALDAGFNHADGIECDEIPIGIAKPFFDRSGLPANYMAGDLLNAHFERRYDFVYCQDVLEHVQSIDLCLNRLNTLRTTNGVVAIRVASGYSVSVVVSESHYRVPHLSLFDAAGAQMAAEAGILRKSSQFVVVRWPTLVDFLQFQASGDTVWFSTDDLEYPDLPFARTPALWRKKLAEMDTATRSNPVFTKWSQDDRAIQWRSKVDRLLALWETGHEPNPYDTMVYFALYWTIAISNKRPSGNWVPLSAIL